MVYQTQLSVCVCWTEGVGRGGGNRRGSNINIIYLLRWHIECLQSRVDFFHMVKAGEKCDEPRTLFATTFDSAKTKYDGSFVLRNRLIVIGKQKKKKRNDQSRVSTHCSMKFTDLIIIFARYRY